MSTAKLLYTITLSSIIMTGCGPSFKTKQFLNETTFINEGVPFKKADTSILESEPRKILSSKEEIEAALNFKSLDKISPDTVKKELDYIQSIIQDDTYLFTNQELATVDFNFQENMTDKNNFVAFENGKKVYPRIKPLVLGRLYYFELTHNNSKAPIPGLILKQKIKAHSITRSRGEPQTSTADSILRDLEKMDLEIKIVKLFGRDQRVQISSSNEVIAFGTINSKGVLEAVVFEELEKMKTKRILAVNAQEIIESLLVNNILNLTFIDASDKHLGTFQFISNIKEIEEIETVLKKK